MYDTNVSGSATIILQYYQLRGIVEVINYSYAIKMAQEPNMGTILVNLSGRGDKDIDFEDFGIFQRIFALQ